ncbi:hypothetical protein BHE74_00031583, partial [Ensete ventricosum]
PVLFCPLSQALTLSLAIGFLQCPEELVVCSTTSASRSSSRLAQRAGCATEAKRSGRRGSGECGCSAIVGHRRRGNLPSHYPLSYSVPAGDSVGLKKPSHRR